jgi:hypothetical protein
LILLNKSKSHIGVLEKNEYNIQTQIIQDTIKVKAEFSKTLPFEHELDNFDKELIFKGNEVSSFGISQFSSDEQKNIINITYYKNDDNFIIKLLPDNKEHQIILFKSSDNYSTIAEMIEEIDKLTYIGKSEMISDRFKWKYTFNKGDWVIIPKINFNLETNFESIVGCSFKTKLKEYIIVKAWQRSALILDESGSSIESEAEMTAAASASPFREEIIKPKKMKFDKPFLLLLKRSDSRNPYFGLWTTNSELMIK